MVSRNNKSRCRHDALSPPSPKRPKKSQADKPTWPFWLKAIRRRTTGCGYFEYVELVVVAGASFF
jgi:hypothetical protein